MVDFLTSYAQSQPDKPAVIDDRPGGPVAVRTFAEFEELTNRLAHVLSGFGCGPGTKVMWCGPNSLGLAIAVHACRKLGTMAVPLNYRLTDDEAAYVTDHCDASIVYTDAEFAPMFARIRDSIPSVRTMLVFGGASPSDPVEYGMTRVEPLMAMAPTTPPATPPADAPSGTMTYTSGTTGKPKGAVRRTGADPAQVSANIAMFGLRTDDVYIPTGPLYHSGPGGFMGIAHALGQTVVIQRKFDPEDWLRLVDKYKVTSSFSAPTPVRMVCALPDEVKASYDRSSMRVMIANAAPWSFALKQQYLADFPPDSLFEIYGSTELGVTCIMRPEDQLRKPGSCGQVSPLTEIKLIAEDGEEVTGFGPEHPGEVFVRSASVFSEYYKAADKFEEDRRGDFQTVGDIAYRDEEGFYYICDRKKDMIISGGVNIYPAEIEAALELHPNVLEAAVFGIPSDQWGESVHAVVVPRRHATLTEPEIDTHARLHLAGYKVPRTIAFADELPKTGSGKILKRELRAPFWAGRDSRV